MKPAMEKVVLITGASSGIGAATCRLLGQSGTKLVLGARRTEPLASLCDEINAAGGNAIYQKVDVTDRDEMRAFGNAAIDRFGSIDVLVNNAGIMPVSPLSALKVDEWDRMIDVNMRGVLNGVAAVLPHFIARGTGQFVNIASLGAHYVVPTGAVYCATKFAVWAITDGIRQEHKDIRATIISPGVVTSELGGDITDGASIQAMADFRKVAIEPDAIARAIRFAIEQPDDVDVSEVIVRPTASDF
ncbi:SDR family NAD(P)-dependent oxidoreductase [Sphingorhabdus sp. Alg231-15]|uniref:SDR family NAD(P)-dependent oxidoreductase n=1 Tax=Sphingorhabdus sp. Alg231-15 TaxID=1922222 RepID=UPI000D54F736